MFLSKLEKLRKVTANERQYLALKLVNGELRHVPGPASEWLNRFQYQSIDVKDMYNLNLSQMIVVYSRDEKTNNVKRRIISGPCMFMLAPNEWLHTFQWHAQDNKLPGHINPNGTIFEILTVKPDFFHYHVTNFMEIFDKQNNF